jgi:hypothetical protein
LFSSNEGCWILEVTAGSLQGRTQTARSEPTKQLPNRGVRVPDVWGFREYNENGDTNKFTCESGYGEKATKNEQMGWWKGHLVKV